MNKENFDNSDSLEYILIKKLQDIKKDFKLDRCHDITALYPKDTDGYQAEPPTYSKIKKYWQNACDEDTKEFNTQDVFSKVSGILASQKEKRIPIKDIVEKTMSETKNPLPEGEDTSELLIMHLQDKIEQYIQYKREKNFQSNLLKVVNIRLRHEMLVRKKKIEKDIEGIFDSMAWGSQSKRSNDKFDSLLFDNFNFDKISRKLKINGPKIQEDTIEPFQKLIWEILYNGIKKTTFKKQFNELLDKKIMGYWKNIMLYLKDERTNTPDSLNEKNSNLLTVNNFLEIMYDNGDEYMKTEIINSFIEYATPAWNYDAHFDDHVKTIATIGCKESNYIYGKIKNLKLTGGVTPEATGEEEDPYEVPMVIEQHGLPFLGYFNSKKYRDSFYMLKNKYQHGRHSFSRPFFLDKRWESGDVLFDPFSSKLASSSLYEAEELFALCLVFKLVERHKQIFRLKISKELAGSELIDVKLNPDGKQEGVKDAKEVFINLIANDLTLKELLMNIINDYKNKDDSLLDVAKDKDLFGLVTQGISDAPEYDQNVFKKMECYIKHFRNNHSQWLFYRLKQNNGKMKSGMLKELKKL